MTISKSKKGEGDQNWFIIGLIIALLVFFVILAFYTSSGKVMIASIKNFFGSTAPPGGYA